jgi:hypothetical protein
MNKRLLILIVLIGFGIFGLAGFFLGRKVITPVSKLQPTKNLLPQVKPGFKLYTDQKLKYGFSYSQKLTVNKCSDLPCAEIAAINLRIGTLNTYYLPINNPKASLLTNDLYCSAAGPMGSTDCINTKVEDYTNSLGFKGYKVFRTKKISGRNRREVKDNAYVFPLKKIVKGEGNNNYAGILFSIDTTSQADFSSLIEIVNSFFTY